MAERYLTRVMWFDSSAHSHMWSSVSGVSPGMPTMVSPPKRRSASQVLCIALIVPFSLFPIAQQHVSSSVAGVVNGGVPVIAAVVSAVIARARPHPAVLAGAALGAVGVAVIVIGPRDGSSNVSPIGVVLLLAAVTCYGVAFNLARPLQQRHGAVAVMTNALGASTVLTAPAVGLTDSGAINLVGAAAVITLGVLSTATALVLFSALIGRAGPTRASIAVNLMPGVAAIGGWVLLDEPLGSRHLVGLALIVSGARLIDGSARSGR